MMNSSAAKSAANTQANAMREASAETREAADKARVEILNRFEPALADFFTAMTMSMNDIKSGATDVMSVLQKSTANASDILASAGANASKALLGSRSYNSGIPRASFEESFARMEAAPTQEARQQIEQELMRGVPAGETRQPIGGGFEPVRQGLGAVADTMRTALGAPTTGGAPTKSFEQFLAEQPQGEWIDNPELGWGRQKAESIQAGMPEKIFQPISDSERRRRATQAYQDSGAAAAAEAEAARVGQRDPRLADVAEMGTPRAGDYLSDIRTGAYGEGPGYFTSVEALERGQAEGLRALTEGTGIARRDITGGLERARGVLDPYQQAGQSALEQEAALSGAMGPEAQQRAIDAFIESPGQKYLREQQEKALLRSSAAIGGLGGGAIRSALQEQAMGIASTQQQQHLQNLRDLATRGQGVAGQIAGMETGAAANLANLAASLGVNSMQLISMNQQQLAALAERTGVRLSDIQSTVGAAQANLAKGQGEGLAGVAGAMAGDIAGLRETSARTGLQAETDLATKLANLATLSGSQAAQYTAGAGSSLAAGEYLQGKTWGETMQGIGNIAAHGVQNLQPQQIQTVQPTVQPVYQPPVQQPYGYT